MSACSRCGTVAKATDKFCNVCGTPLARTGASNAPPARRPPIRPHAPPGAAGVGFAQTQAPPPPGGVASIARCQMGHEIAPGASYCVQGHPIALDQMQFSNEPSYGGGRPQGYAQPAAPATAPRGRPPGLRSPSAQAGYGAAPPYATPGQPSRGTPPAGQFGAPATYGGTPAPQAYAPPPGYPAVRRAGTGPARAGPARTTRRAKRLRPRSCAVSSSPTRPTRAATSGR